MRGALLLVARVGGFAGTIAITRTLPPDEAGLIFMVLALATVMALVSGFGLRDALPRIVASLDARGRASEASGAVRTALLFTCGLALLIAVGDWITAAVLGWERVWVLSSAAMIGALLGVQNVSAALLRARGRVWAAEVWQSLVPLLFIAGLLLMRQDGGGSVALLRVAVEGLVALMVAIAAFRSAPSGPRFGFRRLAATSAPMWITALCWLAIQQADVIILGWMRGPAEVASYVPLLRIADVAVLVFTALIPYVLPQAARLGSIRARAELQHLYETGSIIAFTLSVPVIAALFLNPRLLVGSIFGVGDPGVEIAGRVLAVAYLVNSVAGINGAVLEAVGALRPLVVRSVAALAVSIGADVLLISRFGLAGAALGTLVGFLTVNVLNSWLLLRLVEVVPFTRRMVAVIATGIGTIAFVWLLGVADRGVAGLVAAVGIVTVVSAAVACRPLLLRAARRPVPVADGGIV